MNWIEIPQLRKPKNKISRERGHEMRGSLQREMKKRERSKTGFSIENDAKKISIVSEISQDGRERMTKNFWEICSCFSTPVLHEMELKLFMNNRIFSEKNFDF